MSSNNCSTILIYYLPPSFFPKLFTIFLPYGLKGNAHTFVSWRYWADIFCTNGPSKSFALQESEPGSHNGPHPAFQAPPVILSHTVQLPPPQRLESFWTWGYFSSSLQTFPRSWQKHKKIPHLLHHPHNPPFLFPNPIFPFSSLSSTQVPGTELILWHYTYTTLAFRSLLFFGTLHSNECIFPFLLCL